LVGVSVVVIPATIYLIITKHFVAAGIFFAFNMVQAILVENVIKTRLIGSHMKMHNLLIFLAIIGGLSIFGILGILYGPLVVALFLALAELYHARYKTRLMGTQTMIMEPLPSPKSS
jgi:predicted PurR-regulated permease PerM